jgi:hypothetical protein
MSKYYSILEYSNGTLTFQKKENIKFQEDESNIHGDPEKAKLVLAVLKDVDAVVGKIIGQNIIRIKIKFVPLVVREKEIKKVIEIIKENINEIAEEYNKKERMALVL